MLSAHIISISGYLGIQFFDPLNLAPKTTAQDKPCNFPSDSSPDMDQYDMDEPDPATHPDQFFEPSTSRIKKYDSILKNPDICLTPPPIDKMLDVHIAEDDPYSGESLLRFYALPVDIHPDLKKLIRVKRQPSSTTSYPTPYNPPMTDDTVDLKDVSPSTLVGRRVAKRFNTGIYIGTITETWKTADTHEQHWAIQFDDNDGMDLDLSELNTAFELYKIYPHEY